MAPLPFVAARWADREAVVVCDQGVRLTFSEQKREVDQAATGLLALSRTGRSIVEGDRFCVPAPLYHAAGMICGSLVGMVQGATVVYPGESFDPKATLQAVHSSHRGPDHVHCSAQPAECSHFDLNCLQKGMIGGSPCPVAVMRRLIDELGMRDITIIYGMTETLISTQTARDDAIEQRVATVGRVHPHLDIKIVDLEGRTVPRGIQGKICTRGYSVMPGYWNGAEQTAAAIDGARWMHTVTSARWPVYIRAGTDITTKCAQALHMTTDKQRSDEFVRLRAGATRSHAEIVDRERPAVLIVCAGGTEIVERAVRECVDGTRSRL